MTHLRSPESLMSAERLGAFHPSYLSFSRGLIRAMIAEKWHIECTKFNLDDKGFGHAVYKITTKNRYYHGVFFTQYLDADKRNDRVIAEAWDLCCCLWDGPLTDKDIANLNANLPQQEKGRYSPKVLSISRANKSLRLFTSVMDCLAAGEQPSFASIKQTGYLVRTTAVYGNGKFGMADYAQLQTTDFIETFRAQMLLVYLVRHFSIQWVEFSAKIKNNQHAVKLATPIAQYVGTGNSTGLGMLPFLIAHPEVVNQWVAQREQALFNIFNIAVSANAKTQMSNWLKHAIGYFAEITTTDDKQTAKNNALINALKTLHIALPNMAITDLWQKLYETTKSAEAQELLLNILLEIYPQISEKYAHFPRQKMLNNLNAVKINTLIQLIEKHYCWALNINFDEGDNKYYFWYNSEEKEEPRRGESGVEMGEDRQMQVAIGRDVKHLYQTLTTAINKTQIATCAELLLTYPEHSAAIKRVLNCHHYPYGEIHTNLLAKNFYPIDVLRLKLSFFGAVKFDPKSDKWLRITLFQGAPLLNDNGLISQDDNWFFISPR